jgi:hypothetical protein
MPRKAHIIAFIRPTLDNEQHNSIVLSFNRIGIYSESAQTITACGEVPFEFPFDFEGDSWEEAQKKAEEFIAKYAPALKNACHPHSMNEHMLRLYNGQEGKHLRPTEFDRCRK